MSEAREPGRKTPVLVALIVLLGLVLAAVANRVMGTPGEPSARAGAGPSPHAEAGADASLPPAGLQSGVEAFARREAGRNGIVIRAVEDEWVAGYSGATLFPVGTLGRLWLGAALLDFASQRDPTPPGPSAPVPGQPEPASAAMDLGELLRRSVQHDDQLAQARALTFVVGAEAISRWLLAHGLYEIGVAPSERVTADGMAHALEALVMGRLLDARSTDLLLSYFAEHSHAPPGWKVLRMSGQVAEGDVVATASTVALIRSPQGRRYVIAVLTRDGSRLVERRDRLLDLAIATLARGERSR